MLTVFRHLITHNLLYSGDCRLLGVAVDGVIYAEELYGAEDWLAQHQLTISKGIFFTVDEQYGDNPDITPLKLPAHLVCPDTRACCERLVYSGARLRGLRADERIDEIVLPLSIADKIELVDYMEWDILPMQIIGIAESVILAHTVLADGLMMVCRRIRVAYHLSLPGIHDGTLYDYDSLDVYVLHEYDPADHDLPELVDCLNDIDDVVLLRPMACLYHDRYLYVADGGEGEDVSAIHVFELVEQSESE